MKYLTILAMGLATALTSCNGDPTIEERLEGDWLLNDIIATGDIVYQGQTVSITANDSVIDASSVFTLVDEPNSITAVIDAILKVGSATSSVVMPYANTAVGTWSVKSGEGVAMDSLITTESNGTITRYEIINLLESSVKLRGLMDADVQGTSNPLNFELNFQKQ